MAVLVDFVSDGRGSVGIFNLNLILRAGIWPAPKAVFEI